MDTTVGMPAQVSKCVDLTNLLRTETFFVGSGTKRLAAPKTFAKQKVQENKRFWETIVSREKTQSKLRPSKFKKKIETLYTGFSWLVFAKTFVSSLCFRGVQPQKSHAPRWYSCCCCCCCPVSVAVVAVFLFVFVFVCGGWLGRAGVDEVERHLVQGSPPDPDWRDIEKKWIIGKNAC